VTNGMDLAVSTDTMVSGTHFFPDVNPENLGHKALAVNLSDIAAMGGMPYWAMLALTLPNVDHDWLAAFAKGFFDLAQEYNVSLIGGDTTRGPALVMTVTIMGEVPAGAALRRGGAKAGNDIWVSGNVGDAALAVAHRYGRIVLDANDYHEAVMRLYEPSPRVALGQALRGLATAAIDISDGLLADLTHICRLSGVGANGRPRLGAGIVDRHEAHQLRRGGATRSSPAATTTSCASPRTRTRARASRTSPTSSASPSRASARSSAARA
jgi:thiamine-monophosphate kinase